MSLSFIGRIMEIKEGVIRDLHQMMRFKKIPSLKTSYAYLPLYMLSLFSIVHVNQ